MHKLTACLLCLLCLLNVTGCKSSQVSNVPNDSPIKLGMLAIEDNLPFFIAEYDGLFNKLGLKVELIPFNSARERDVALEAGEIQGELADLVAVALIKKGGTNVKVVSLGLGVTPREGRFVIMAAPGSNITKPSQLVNLPIAVSQHTIIHYLAEQMLRETGILPSSVKLQNIPDLKVRLEALLAGTDVKVALLPDPLATLAESSGAKAIIDDTTLPVNLSQTVILFREETIRQRGMDVRKILQAYRYAAISLNENPQTYQDLIIKKARIPKPLENSYQPPHFSRPVLPTRDMVTRIMTWMVSKELLAKPYSYEEIVASGLLEP